MRNHDGFPVDRIAGLFPSRVAAVHRDLVPHQVEVDPFLGRAPDAALKNPGIEGFRRGQVIDSNRQVKPRARLVHDRTGCRR